MAGHDDGPGPQDRPPPTRRGPPGPIDGRSDAITPPGPPGPTPPIIPPNPQITGLPPFYQAPPTGTIPPVVPYPPFVPPTLPKPHEFTVVGPFGKLIPARYGLHQIGGDVPYVKSTGQYLFVQYVLNEGPVEAVTDIMFDEVSASDWGDVAYDVHLGDTVAGGGHHASIITSSIDPDMGSDFPGLCWIEARFGNPADRSGTGSNTGNSSGGGSNVPSLKCTLKGLKPRDPRAGMARAYSTNNALILSDFWTKKRYGGGMSDSMVDFSNTVTVAANRCDDVLSSGPPVVKRFEASPVFNDQKQSLQSWTESFRSTFQAYCPYNSGVYQIVINLPRSNCGVTFRDVHLLDAGGAVVDPANIVGLATVSRKGQRDTPTRVIINFIDRSIISPAIVPTFKEATATAEEPGIADGTVEAREVTYDLKAAGVMFFDQAKRIATYILNHATVADAILRFSSHLIGIEVLPGARCTIIIDALGFTGSVDWVLLDSRPDPSGMSWGLDWEPYSDTIFLDTVQTGGLPLSPPGPLPNAAPPVPTGLTVVEEVLTGTDGRKFSRLKITWTHNGSMTVAATRVMVSNGITTTFEGDIGITTTLADGPVYYDNPRLGVLHTINIYSVGLNGKLSTAVSATITPVYTSDPVPNVTSLTAPHAVEADLGKFWWDFPTGPGSDVVSYFDVYDNFGSPANPPYLFTIAKDSNPTSTQPIIATQAIHGSPEIGRDMNVLVKTVNRLGDKSTGVSVSWHVDGTLLERTRYFYAAAVMAVTNTDQSFSGCRSGSLATGHETASSGYNDVSDARAFDHRVTDVLVTSGETTTIVRTLMEFITNGILPGDAIIDGIDLEIYGTYPQSCVVHVVSNLSTKSAWPGSSQTDILDIFQKAMENSLTPTNLGGHDMSTYTGSGHKAIPLNAAGIALFNLLGRTKYTIITENDLINSAPTLDAPAHTVAGYGWGGGSTTTHNVTDNAPTIFPGVRLAVHYRSISESLGDGSAIALQGVTPGSTQVGNGHIDGTFIAGQFELSDGTILGGSAAVRLQPVALSGTMDGSNAIFAFPENVVSGAALVLLNGAVLLPGIDYTISGMTVTLLSGTLKPDSANNDTIYGVYVKL